MSASLYSNRKYQEDLITLTGVQESRVSGHVTFLNLKYAVHELFTIALKKMLHNLGFCT